MSEDTHPTMEVREAVRGDQDKKVELPTETPTDLLAEDGNLSQIDAEDADFLTMEVTVDISDCSDTNKRVLHTLARQYEQAFREVVEKNRSYGFAFIETGNEIARRADGQFNTPHRATANGLYHRTGDKRARFYRRMFTDCDDAGEDPVSQTAKECGNYWLMMSVVAGNPELVSEYVNE